MRAAIFALTLCMMVILPTKQVSAHTPLYYSFNQLWLQQHYPQYSAYQLERFGFPLRPHYAVSADERAFVAGFEHLALWRQCAAEPARTRVQPHYPGFKSGCTHGFGYDMGVRRQSRTYRDLQEMLPAKTAKQCTLAYSLTPHENWMSRRGSRARSYCPQNHVDRSCMLTCSEAGQLLDQQVAKAKRRVLKRAAADGIRFSAQQLQALISLDYNNPVFVSGSTNLWRHLKAGAHKSVAKEILRNSGSQKVRQLQNRRNREALVYLLGTGMSYADAKKVVRRYKRY